MTTPAEKKRKIIRWTVRLLFLAAAMLFAAGGPLPTALARLFPSASPLVALASAVATRQWHFDLLRTTPSLLLLVLAFWKGRVFCRWICPVGTVYSIPARLSFHKTVMRIRVSGYLFWIILFASLAGAPLLLFTDPLSTFNRIGPVLAGAHTAASTILGLLLPLFLLLGFLQPMIWCTYCCPLGYLFDLCHSLRRSGVVNAFSPERRQIVIGLFVGLPLAILAEKFRFFTKKAGVPSILPPGANDPETFASVCTRCYACVAVCPTRIIQVGWPAGRAPGQFFQPEIKIFESADDPNIGYCPEWCNKCSGVCHAGALQALTLEEKSRRQIGVARVIQSACLAWADNQYCMVCQEYCPYQAIEANLNKDVLARPVVNSNLCRGCGMCQSKCPAERAGKAIVVEGVKRQTMLAALILAP